MFGLKIVEATVEAATIGFVGFNSTIEFILFSIGLTLVEAGGNFEAVPSTEADLATVAEAVGKGVGTLVTGVLGHSILKLGPKLEADDPAVEGVVNVVQVLVSVVLRFSSLLVSSSKTLFLDSNLCTIALGWVGLRSKLNLFKVEAELEAEAEAEPELKVEALEGAVSVLAEAGPADGGGAEAGAAA